MKAPLKYLKHSFFNDTKTHLVSDKVANYSIRIKLSFFLTDLARWLLITSTVLSVKSAETFGVTVKRLSFAKSVLANPVLQLHALEAATASERSDTQRKILIIIIIIIIKRQFIRRNNMTRQGRRTMFSACTLEISQ